MATMFDLCKILDDIKKRDAAQAKKDAAHKARQERVYRSRFVVVRKDWTAEGEALELVSGWATRDAAQSAWAKELNRIDTEAGRPAGDNAGWVDVFDRKEFRA